MRVGLPNHPISFFPADSQLLGRCILRGSQQKQGELLLELLVLSKSLNIRMIFTGGWFYFWGAVAGEGRIGVLLLVFGSGTETAVRPRHS